MKYVKSERYALAAMIFVFFFVPSAFSQDAVMTLMHKEIASHQRSPVKFNHEAHSGKLDCARCHHDFDKYLNNRGGEDKAQPCANCHGKPAVKNVPPMTEAFHGQCKRCHEDLRSEGVASGPVMCGECHVRK